MAKAIASSFIGLLFITLNLLFFTMVTSTYIPCPPKTQHKNHPPSISKGGYHKCPKDTLKLKVCGNLLNDLVHVVVGSPLLSSKSSCCSLIENLADVDAAVCLCTAIKANVLGTHINAALSLTLLLNNCGKTAPRGFKCA
ncbi:14 kDa proline-rich protein DC2.15-like [Solanum dulcamara]|uniref:14 kDa proline-rich protein DC2.15-like n=1 Tax=Solanum dulcamara TaxID=45834 RepID=UPI002486B9DA|nr:14 kDa proline-rich protein DC2.15-like [Solanum dulcamara]